MKRILILISLFGFGLGACGSDDDGAADPTSDAALCQHMIDLCGSQLPFTRDECLAEARNSPPTEAERQCIANTTTCNDLPSCDPDDCACDVDFDCSASCDCDPECSGDAGAG